MTTHWIQNNYTISTKKDYLDIDLIHYFLSQESYWATDIPKSLVEKSIDHSALCFGVYERDPNQENIRMVVFARVISDLATFAYLADVFIVKEHRGKGLSKWLMNVIMNHEMLQGLRVFLLGTKDAHSLYEKSNFTVLDNSNHRFMAILKSS